MRSVIFTLLAALVAPAGAVTKLPAIFGDHMVLQADRPVAIWGWDDPGQEVLVEFAGGKSKAVTGEDGKWKASLQALKMSREGRPLTIKGSSTVTIKDVLVGEVWVCSGQSNMQWPVANANDSDLESLSANYPQIRLITVPQVGTQELQDDFKGQWTPCTPQSVRDFSAVGYFFGRQLHRTLDVPIGLIDNSWGGSAAEAWVRRDVLEADPKFAPLMTKWLDTETTYDHDAETAKFETRRDGWKQRADEAKAAGKPVPARPRPPRNPLTGQHRPGNLYGGVLNPIIGYGIRGVIWYQGETNAGRAWEYRRLFPLMIWHWRKEWGQGDYPFYWAQLADYRDEVAEPGGSEWAELREAQTFTMRQLPNTGEAVIVNLGEATDIHPRNKQDVAKRLARWALARDYGLDLVYRSPEFKSMLKKGDRIVVTFDHVGGGLDTFDVRTPKGFAIAGVDQQFVNAEAKIVGADKIEVWSAEVPEPYAVRYAWADNPVCNVQNKEGLPLTPFRTDDWPMVTEPAPDGK